jgi:hypothetical protein
MWLDVSPLEYPKAQNRNYDGGLREIRTYANMDLLFA